MLLSMHADYHIVTTTEALIALNDASISFFTRGYERVSDITTCHGAM